MESDDVSARIAAVHEAYPGVWASFLRNCLRQAGERAEALLGIINTVPETRKDTELWVTEGDFAYIAGAARGNDPSLLQVALTAYTNSFALSGKEGQLSRGDGGNNGARNANARRMYAETLLRLRRYDEAFAIMAELAAVRVSPWKELEVPPFRLRHDAALCMRLAKLGRLTAGMAVEAAAALRSVAACIDSSAASGTAGARKWSTRWPRIADLDEEVAAMLRRGLFDELWQICAPYPTERLSAWGPGTADPLNAQVDWPRAEAEYLSKRLVVVDDFFSPEALDELWCYAREAPCFRTVRNGFLGAFPADGNVHPIISSTARSLESRMPRVMEGHPLGLWWLFKYTEGAPSGIGIHADQAAVNVNIWLTPDSARRSGGGLDIFMHVAPEEARIEQINHEFATPGDEAKLRAALIADGGVERIEYRQNRAVVFVSDLFHASVPFDFVDCEEQPRVNLTCLFGDRAADRSAPPLGAAPVGATGTVPEPGWNLFE